MIGHLLRWQHQPEHRSRSWLAALRIQRLEIADLLDDNPSLQPYLQEALPKAYLKAVELAVSETNLPNQAFPTNCPYTLDELLDPHFYPGEPSELLN